MVLLPSELAFLGNGDPNGFAKQESFLKQVGFLQNTVAEINTHKYLETTSQNTPILLAAKVI